MNAAANTVAPDTTAFAEPRLARALLEQWPGATLVLDAAFDVRWLNRRAARWLRSSAESLVARPWQELPLPWKIDRSLLQSVLYGTEKRLPPADLVDLDGGVHACAARLLPLQLEGGAPGVLLLIDEMPESRPAADSDSQRLRRRDLALASAQVGFWEWSPASGQASIETEWCRLLEIDPCTGAAHSEAWARNVHPDDQPEFCARIQALGSGEAEQIEVEYRVLTRDYRWVWILQRGRIVERAADGTPQCISGICIDIDERKRNEVDLRESESRLANALWGARAALWQWNVPGKSGNHSPMWFAMTGYTEEEWNALPDPWMARVHPDDRAGVLAAAREHFEGRAQSLEYEYRIRTAAGDWHWMLDRGRIVAWDLAGAPTVVIGVSLDIHAQKDAETRLRASEARLETAIWGADLGLWEVDFATMRTTWLNDWCAKFDIEPHEGEVAPWGAEVHPDDLPAIQDRLAAHATGQSNDGDVEFRARTCSGGWKWLLARGRIERAADGSPVRAIGVCMDIHARKVAETAAQEAQQRLRLALSGVVAGVWEWSRDRGITAGSRAVYCRMLGLDAGDAGRSVEGGEALWYARIHPDDMERFRAGTAGVFAGTEDSYQIEYRVRHADGSWLWVLDRGRPLERDETGATVRATGFILDVSANRQAEAALIASEQRFRLATEAVRGMIYEIDPASGRIERYGIERLLGYRPGEVAVTWEGWESLVHPDDRRNLAGSYEAIFGTWQAAEVRYRLRHRNGHYVHVWDRAVALRDASGKLVKVVGFAMDVTEQKRMEREILGIANREQRRLGSDLHDGLGQDLTGIALLLRGIDAQLRGGAAARHQDIEQVIQLVNAAIETTRGMASGLSPVSTARGGLVAALRALADRSGERFAVRIGFSSRLPGSLAIDEEVATQLYRIAQEAITNAVRHARPEHVWIELGADEQSIRLCIRDDGCGFEPASASGDGMGLKIMQYRAQMLGGDLAVRASPAGGVEVCCICPRGTATAGRGDARPQPAD